MFRRWAKRGRLGLHGLHGERREVWEGRARIECRLMLPGAVSRGGLRRGWLARETGVVKKFVVRVLAGASLLLTVGIVALAVRGWTRLEAVYYVSQLDERTDRRFYLMSGLGCVGYSDQLVMWFHADHPASGRFGTSADDTSIPIGERLGGHWLFKFSSPRERSVMVPYWAAEIGIVLLAVPWVVWRRGERRRRRLAGNLCVKCGYDLRGSGGATAGCPECGEGRGEERGTEARRH